MPSQVICSSKPRSISGRPAQLCLSLAALALLAAACSHTHEDEIRDRPFTRVFSPQPPLFLNGPMAVLLTNTAGFIAGVTTATESLPSSEPAPSGQLLCRGSKLLFAPDPNKAEKPSASGGFSYLWDVAENRGYVLSEALQGYAPVAAKVQATNLVTGTIPATPRKFAGHTCAPADASVQMSDGSTAIFQILRATDLNGFPVHISSATNPVPLTLSFSKVRLEPPSADVFALPEGFTKYSSPEAMADELAIRQHNLKRKNTEDIKPLERPSPGSPPGSPPHY